jgi:hypothetical protein
LNFTNEEFQAWIDKETFPNVHMNRVIANYILDRLEKFADDRYDIKKCFISETLWPWEGSFYGIEMIPMKGKMFDHRRKEYAVIFQVD